MLAELAQSSSFDSLDSEKSDRTDWVEMQLCKNFMRDTRQAMMGTFVGSWVMVGILYNSASLIQLLTWVVIINVVTLFRYLVLFQYKHQMRDVSGPALQAFFKRYDVWWILAGVLWGASSYLFFGKATGFEQLICCLILIGVSCFSVYSYAARLGCFFSFSNSLCGAALIAFTFELLVVQAVPLYRDSLGLIVLIVVFHLMTRYFAIRFHGLQRTSLQLVFDNDVLIKSLTAKTTDALRAVENKNRFIASAAHDLRQPVHALNLYASWLADEPQLSAQVVPQIVRCTKAVDELFNSLFAFSALNIESTPIVRQDVNLADLLEDLRHQYAPLAQERGIELRLRKGEGHANTDPVLLRRLLGNLVSNALKNTVRGGVVLALRERAGLWRIEVKDTGKGVDVKHQKAIFEEFYRVPSQGTQEGFGLGLAISTRLSQLLGLTIKMRSLPGRGSVFWVESSAS